MPSLLDDLYASSGILVGFCACVVPQLYLLTVRVQLAFFCMSAFALWQRRSQEEQQKGWGLYGWFTGLPFCGSVAGAIAYGCRMRQFDLFYLYSNSETIVSPSSVQLQDMHATRAESRRWTAAHFALFPFELAFVVLAKLLVLHRMQRFAVGSASHPQRWRQARRSLLAVVVLLNALGICGNFGAAFYYNQAADSSMDAANSFGANNTAAGKVARVVANEKHQLAGEVASIQRFAEVSVLILIITAFLTVGVFSTQVIASALRTLFVAGQALVSVAGAAGEQGRLVVAAANLQGRALQRKVIVTFVFVFLTLLVRSVFTILYAVAQAPFKTMVIPAQSASATPATTCTPTSTVGFCTLPGSNKSQSSYPRPFHCSLPCGACLACAPWSRRHPKLCKRRCR